ncbi:tRNA (adenosine(37)-N6)-dimethylallyltransferase MiaA [Frigoriglobus tundricola]|nr:tRNA (adenosine(37)-N6)-dimethylallyltransferase MiaA [Frigoriglobus tundricola]
MSALERALVLTGPTACGKTALALDLAERIGGEIVALDSMTVYRGMDIGTAKPTAAERARVPHHLIDVLDPWESLTVAWWLARAEAACTDAVARGKRPIFVGGTPFYLKALLHGLFDGPPGDGAVRTALEAEAARIGNAALHARLAAVDPKTAARLHPNDVRAWCGRSRFTRSPVSRSRTGSRRGTRPRSRSRRRPPPPPARVPAVVLELPRDALYDRINRRVSAMLDAGWLDEVRRLRELPHPLSREARQALGYRELLEHLEAGRDRAETADLIRTHTRQFAKRQLTWFRHLPALVPVPADAPDAIERVLKAWASQGG